MQTVTIKRFKENINIEHESTYHLCGHIGKWLISIDPSARGNYKGIASFNLWLDNNLYPQISRNRFIYSTKDYNKFLEYIDLIKKDKLVVKYNELTDKIESVTLKKESEV